MIKEPMTNDLSVILYFQTVRDSDILPSTLNFIERYSKNCFYKAKNKENRRKVYDEENNGFEARDQ